MAPTIVFVPGIWEGPTVFDKVTLLLESEGFSTRVASLVSTGRSSPGNPNMLDDIANIRSTILEAVEANENVLLVLHSAGGFLGSAAMENVAVKTRKERGLKGGVVKILFMTAGASLVGSIPPLLPFFQFDGPVLNCVNPRENLYHELPEAEQDKWLIVMQPQPSEDWNREIPYCGFKDVPSAYLICEGDRILPAELQLQVAKLVGSTEILRCKAGHMVQLSMPEKVVEVVKHVLQSL